MDISRNRPVPGKNFVARMQVEGDGRFNPSSRESCQKCSEQNGLSFAWANGRKIFLCARHYKEWFTEAHRDKELVRQVPFRQVAPIGVDGEVTNQDKRVF